MFLAGTSFTLHYRTLDAGRGRTGATRSGGSTPGSSWLGHARVALLIGGDGVPLEQRSATPCSRWCRSSPPPATAPPTTLWAPGAQIVLFLLFFLGGMAGSTAGGMKMIRVLLVLKHAWLEIRKQLHPRAVFVPKVGGKAVREHVMLNVLGFVLLYMLLFGLGHVRDGAARAVAAGRGRRGGDAISNVGPALAELGPTANFGGCPGRATSS
jgi:hypothetical protein